MRVLHVTCSAFPFHSSGVATIIKNVSHEMRKLNHQVYVFTISTSKEFKNGEIIDKETEEYCVRAIALHNSIDNFFNTFTELDYNNKDLEKHFYEYLLTVQPQVVHFHSIQGMGANLISLAHNLGYKTVLSMHDWWWLCPHFFLADCYNVPCNQIKIDRNTCYNCVGQLNELKITKQNLPNLCVESFLEERDVFLGNILENHIDCVLTVSDYLRQYIKQDTIKVKKLLTNSNGVEKPKYVKPQNSIINKDTIVFGFLGGNSEIKGYNILIDAFSKLDKGGWELHIYGIGESLDKSLIKGLSYLKKLKFRDIIYKFREKSKLNNQLLNAFIKIYPKFSPERKDTIFQKIDVLIAASIVKESSSLVVREALIRNIPVITTASGGAEEVVVNGKNGIVLENNTAMDLKIAVETVLSANKVFINNIKMDILEIRDTRTQTVELLEIYRSL